MERGGQVLLTDLNNALAWTFNHFDEIAADVTKLISVAGFVGLGTNPTVAAAEAAANAVLAAISAAKAKAAGGSMSNVAAAASAAYSAVKKLQVAHAQAAMAVAANGKS